MTLRTSKTPGRAIVHVEVPRSDEVAAGLAAPSGPVEASLAVSRDPSSGRLADRYSAMELGRKGGLAKAAQRAKLSALESLGLRPLGASPTALAPFLESAEAFAEHEIQRLAQDVGGGVCGAGPATMVQSAALQLAASRYLFSTGDPQHAKLASSLANDSRQNLLAAHHTCALAAASRPPPDPMDRWRVD